MLDGGGVYATINMKIERRLISMHKKITKKILIFILLVIGFFTIENVFAEETLFEGVGHYAIATAGNNNANRGTSFDAEDYSLILDYPSNWDTIKQNIPNNVLSRINNMSGSYLDFSGDSLKTYLSAATYFRRPCPTTIDILVIAPDGTYNIYSTNAPQELCEAEAGITSLIEILNKGSGWYYISFLDVQNWPQQAWAITTIYESPNILMNYLKIIEANTYIGGSKYPAFPETYEVYFNSLLNLKNNFQLYGVIPYGGTNGWHRYETSIPELENTTQDRVWAILSDGTYQQLYESTYNGKNVFQGRTSIDFVNDTFNTIRSHNIQGGELDVFNENLSSDYFGGKEIVGYKFQKDGTDTLNINLLGLSQEVEAPDITITADIERNTNGIIDNKVTLTNNSEYNACSTMIEIPIDSNLTNIRNVVMNPSNIATYKVENNIITVTFNEQFKAHDTFSITYLADEIVVNKEQLDLDPVGTAFPADGTACPSEILNNKGLQIKVTDHDDIKMTQVIVPDTGTFISIATIMTGIAIIGIGYFIPIKNKKEKTI